MEKQRYIIVSGEGEIGTPELTNPITEIGLKRKLTIACCHGDRWAHAYYADPYEAIDGMHYHEAIGDDHSPLMCGSDCLCKTV